MKIVYLLVFAIFALLVGTSNLEAEGLGPNLAFVASYDTNGSTRDVTISGNYAYVADGDDGLVILNIEDPTNLILAGSYGTSGYANGVTISGNYAYVGGDQLVILNIKDPTNPTLVGSYDTVNAYGITISGNYAYVADDYDGLVILNIEDPANPTFAGRYGTNDAWGVTISGNYAYVADGYDGLVILNIEDPANPNLLGSYDTDGKARDVVISGNYAYVACWDNGLVILNIEDPANPTFAGSYSYDIYGYATGVTISGDYAYVADNSNGLLILGLDSDNDKFADLIDAFPINSKEYKDTDGDGMGDNEDFMPTNPKFKTFWGLMATIILSGGIVVSLFMFGGATYGNYVVGKRIVKGKAILMEKIEQSKQLGINVDKLDEIIKEIESGKDEAIVAEVVEAELVLEPEPESIKDET
jgi:hypothetical protein